MYFSKEAIEAMPRIRRLNMINCITGIKPGNLIGTQSDRGQSNVAIFSNIVHLGSDPALLGIIFRPQHEKPRDTYLNIKSSGAFTVNAIPTNLIEHAHYTSAKFPQEVSEFDRCGLTKEYLHDFSAPFVKESPLKIGLELVEEIPITTNNTIMLVGRILHLQFPDDMMEEEGHLNLETINTVGIGGLNQYYRLQKIAQFPYAHLKDVPDFNK
ncbi:flavin reductase family protein [Algivirga pacifica]|uniref:Flavin reductase n=1 Tax=Algivirga pacifica TaxID=1162670 RepID=A0ABP9DEK0_9BACT